MATLYFTNNADSGDGSLRAAIESAASGDVIQPDPSVFAVGKTIEILLDSQLSSSVSLTLRGAGRRIRLNAQQLARIFLTSYDVALTFEDVDFINGSFPTTCGGICANAAPSLVLRRCLLASIESSANVGAVGSVSSSKKWQSVEAYDSIFTNLNSIAIGRSDSISLNFCTVAGNLRNQTNGVIENSIVESADALPSAAGFVAPPPDNLAEWTAGVWENWDFRLRYDSTNASGASGVSELSVDFLGNTRKPGGALGAYEGRWLIVPSGTTETVSEIEAAADYLELSDGGEIFFETPDAIMRVESSASLGAGTISGPVDGWGFLVVPYPTESQAATDRADVVQSSAGLLSASASTAGASWTAENLEVPIVIQKEASPNFFETVASASGGSYDGIFEKGSRLRFFDGFKFLTASVEVPITTRGDIYIIAEAMAAVSDPDFHVWKAKKWEVVKVQKTTVRPYQSTALMARIADAFVPTDYLLNTGENIESVAYTARKKTTRGFSTGWVDVAGHSGVNVDVRCVLASLTKTDAWTVDDLGYTFALTPDVETAPLFPDAGKYQIIVTITPKNENAVVIYYDFEVKDEE